jgi:polysaccharide biosynthesis protein PslH
MKILFVSAIMPYPLYSGGQIRIYNLLKRLATKHEITLICFFRKYEEIKYIANLNFIKVIPIYRGNRLRFRYLLKFLAGQSLLLASYENSEVRRTISDLASQQKFDLIHLEPFYVISSLPKLNIPCVIAEHNVEYQVYQDYARSCGFPVIDKILAMESQRIRFAEENTLKSADQIISVSGVDAEVISQITGRKNINIIPNGVDTEFFSYKDRSLSKKLIFLFVGSFKWLPNREVLQRLLMRIWPKVSELYPSAELRIVGKDIPNNFKRNNYLRVTFADNVNDIRNEYNQATALLSPVQISGGSKYKILESIATGLPVITSPECLSGIDDLNEKHVIIAVKDQEYVDAVDKLIKNFEKYKSMAKNARKLIELKYNWKLISEKLDDVWQKTIK